MIFVIDMQNDFVDEDKGILSVTNAKELVPKIIKEIQEQEKKGEPVYYTLNQHELEDDDRSDEEKQWGLKLVNSLKEALKNHKAIKKKFHSISPEDAAELRNQYEDDPDRVIKFVGVETNVCVLSNAIMLHNSFPLATITVLKDLCAGSTEKLHNEALDVLESLKINIL
ncbi:cysteine hydrolase [Carnobacterium viridans]|uniref:Nicotinamidase-related amidase n=1 Tax=Carnobacterium viridans TaxID=174587 RepID=A0A1H0ZAS3_9LACT|nr:isochorismatase family cysteine hydrolase [Carnobacterium viridans]UDE94724.1 cysteine hydrolase [Carnobacterium viridans]SDQ24543.1 Nicotinamidase-related amidase [Carnobacterium viridans]